jgi:SMODS-associating 2TM, beta-strand rich effector domain
VSQEHEYALIGGINRAKIGRYLALVAAIVSSGIVFLLLSAVHLAQRLGVPVPLTPTTFSLVGAGTIFVVLYWIFDRFAWRWRYLSLVLKVPDLRGSWHCDGQTLNPDGSTNYVWTATVTITQSWDKIRVRLKTVQSGSNSISAALVQDTIEGYALLYHYRNDPRVGEPELRSHRGFAELRFTKDCLTAEGDYFNGPGRQTFGTMRLKRL